MKKLTIILLTLALLATPFAGNLRSIAAQEKQTASVSLAPQANLLSDDFESYSPSSAFPAGSWINHNSGGSAWSIVSDAGNQKARQTAAATCIISNGNAAWTNYRVSAKIKAVALGLRHGIMARFTTTSAYYSLYIRTTTGGSKVFELNKRSGSSNVVLGNLTLPSNAFNVGEYYKLTLDVDGSTLKAYFNDELKLERTDDDCRRRQSLPSPNRSNRSR